MRFIELCHKSTSYSPHRQDKTSKNYGTIFSKAPFFPMKSGGNKGEWMLGSMTTVVRTTGQDSEKISIVRN